MFHPLSVTCALSAGHKQTSAEAVTPSRMSKQLIGGQEPYTDIHAAKRLMSWTQAIGTAFLVPPESAVPLLDLVLPTSASLLQGPGASEPPRQQRAPSWTPTHLRKE